MIFLWFYLLCENNIIKYSIYYTFY